MPVGYHSIAPIDNTGETAIHDINMVVDKVAVNEDIIKGFEPSEVFVNLGNHMMWK